MGQAKSVLDGTHKCTNQQDGDPRQCDAPHAGSLGRSSAQEKGQRPCGRPARTKHGLRVNGMQEADVGARGRPKKSS